MAYHDITDINLNYVQHRTLKRKLQHHQNQLFERYSKLLMLRVDFSYKRDSDSRIEGDIHSTVADITLLLQRCQDINGLVGYAWVLEHTEQHGYHIHAAFYLNGQKRRRAWGVFEALRDTWKYVTWEEGYSYRCESKEHYKVRGEWVTAHDDIKGRKGMQYILSYLSKQDQKNQGVICQLSSIPAAHVSGRRRKTS
ncbi:inovirus-type Gp2 protein [Pectobacterium brasiliense]|uniref:Inovirus-type Gp2 protein n=1 Tax=Pectobacterium brasiliense TaxID=180957 RepID=A0AAE2WE36_9GAMM|nr:inovirus-type Gp2 protein [Pectobacterium brasiliense]MBA0217736.1 inovirus-type Gp2 protein [Pectobacterium brasiliense]MBN3051245.1 inovirus-type Gp2 protein [Pectobacterium brasiliense]MBN3071017.1 inovirus-type Gp2 protein [Pectobacterium brasiliense]MBN3170179.1 inovirus-type Gp2 protein [Pectobacterium brasiliense]